MGASPNRRFRLLTVPAAVPHLASGVRVAAGSAVIAAVVGESLIGSDGLGVEFSLAYRQLELPRAFGAAIVIVVVSVLVFAARRRARTGRPLAVELTLADPIYHLKRTTESETP